MCKSLGAGKKTITFNCKACEQEDCILSLPTLEPLNGSLCREYLNFFRKKDLIGKRALDNSYARCPAVMSAQLKGGACQQQPTFDISVEQQAEWTIIVSSFKRSSEINPEYKSLSLTWKRSVFNQKDKLLISLLLLKNPLASYLNLNVNSSWIPTN